MQNLTPSKEEKNTFDAKDLFSLYEIQKSKNSKKTLLCEKCNKLFSTKHSLKDHINFIHNNYRPFKCLFPNCDKEYLVEAKLITHLRTHIGIKPFICQICQKSFNEKGNLKSHLKFHSEIRPFKCPLCEKEYKSNIHLKNHIKINHFKIKEYSCQFCHKKFGRSSALKVHTKIHTKEKIFKCEFEGCEKCFIEKRSMELHYATHFKNLNLKNVNIKDVKVRKTYGPKIIQKDFEEKIQIALDQLDNKNNKQMKNEKKNRNLLNINKIEKKENFPQDDIKYNNLIRNNKVINSNLKNSYNFTNSFPLIFNLQNNNANNINNFVEKNEKNYDDIINNNSLGILNNHN